MMANNIFIEGQTGLWEVVIGLEVHAQIHSKAKLFSGASTEFGADPNTQVDFLDAGLPGILPVINSYCVDQAIKTGLGFHGDIQMVSVFDRKNYFYADLPLGYQISQFTKPIVKGGYVDISVDGQSKRINITRLHIEQDAGKSVHDIGPSHSYIDLNRAGIALMEIVSEPEMHSAAQAQAYVKKLRTLLRYLGTCDGNMEQGSLRVDANVSLHRPGTPFGTRAEIKNVNSVRFLGQAIDYEIARQMVIVESGGVVLQETRLFDPQKGETRSMRSKEDAHDYRYFPDPDLKPLVITSDRLKRIQDELPELPDDKRLRFISAYGLSDYDADVLVSERETAAYFESVVSSLTSKASVGEKSAPKVAANWLIVEVFGAMNREGVQALSDLPFTPQSLAQLVGLIIDDVISGKIAKEVFGHMWSSGESPVAIVERLGLTQVSDQAVLEAAILKVIADNPNQVAAYRSGKTQLLGFFVGTTMKALAGKANPKLLSVLVAQHLK